MQNLKLTTDQNVPIEVELAGVGLRLLAVLIDLIVLLAYFVLMLTLIYQVFSSDFNMFDSSTYDLLLFIFVFTIYLPFLLYTPLMEYFTKGQTVGKILLGIRVTKINGENAKFKDYFTRWIFRPYEAYFMLFSFGGILFFIASFFFDTLVSSISYKNQRIGDFMANTVVIRKKPSSSFSVTDIVNTPNKENYTPKYQGVTIYTDEDMMFVKKVIIRVETYKNKHSKELAIELADKIASDLKIEEKPKKKLKFLKSVLNDYIVLTR